MEQQQQGNTGQKQGHPDREEGGQPEGEEQLQHPQFYNQIQPPYIYGYHMEQGWVHPGGNQYSYHYQQPMYYGYQYPPLQHMEGVPLPPGIPGLGGSTDPLEAVLGPFPCVRLRNLPYDSSLEDILAFFQGLVLIDVVLVGHGNAFVIFANPMDFQMALQRNRQTIGRSFLEISAASRSDYYEAVAAVHEQERGPLLRSSGSRVPGSGGSRGGMAGEDPHPPGDSSAASSVTGLWSSGGDTPGPIHSYSSLHGAGSSASAYDSGLVGQHLAPGAGMMPLARTNSGGSGGMGLIGPPQRGLHAPMQKRTGGGIQVGEHTGFLRMRGLPFSAAKDDIIKFFSGYNPVPESVVLTYRNDGRATGEAYVGFASPDDSRRAMDLHRRTMGNRYIELFISNKDEQGRALARFGNR